MKNRIKAVLAAIIYWLYEKRILKQDLQVMSIDETLDELLNAGKSMVRFGDGEIVMICGKSLYFQHASAEFSKRLADILQYREDGLLVTIPDIFNGVGHYRKSSEMFWKDHLMFFRKVYKHYCNPERKYGNTSVSRCYISLLDRKPSKMWFEKFKLVWKEKSVVVVEGEGTHNGVGNDLFDGAKEIKRILCPAENAGDFQAEILTACLEMPSDALFLLSLGPAAKLLAQDLFHAGRRVIDIGNLDMEYEWFLLEAENKVKLPKHSIRGIEANEEAGYTEYLRQIVRRIGV